MNKTNEPPVTSAGKENSPTIKVTQDDLKALKNAAPMDEGDLAGWLWTNFSAQKGIDIHDFNQTKILWAYLSVFDGFLNHGHSWSDEAVLNYVSEQFDEFGLANLTAIAKVKNSLIALQQKIWPQTLQTQYYTTIGTNEFDSGIFWINHNWNNTVVDAYKQARQFWKDHNLDSQVVGKTGDKALGDLEDWIDVNLSKKGTQPPLGNFTEYYNNLFSKFIQGYNVPMSCEGISTTAAFLLRAQNHLYIDNGTVVNGTARVSIPLSAVQIQMPDHTDVGYIDYDSPNYTVSLTLSDDGWTVYQSDKSQYHVQDPPAFWYEIEGPNGLGYHTRYGQADINIRRDFISPPYYNVTAVPANETNQETNYSLIIEYVHSAREGPIKVVFGVGSGPYTRGVYDLLNRDYVPVPEFRDILIPSAAAVAMGLGVVRVRWKRE